MIDDWLYNNSIKHTPGKYIEFTSDERMKADFYLPDYDIYIEYWGLDDPNYLQRKKRKKHLYKRYRLNLLSINNSDLRDLNRKLCSLLYSKYIPLTELIRSRTNKKQFFDGYFTIGYIKWASDYNFTNNGVPYIYLDLVINEASIRTQVWGNKEDQNVIMVKNAQPFDKIQIINPILPRINYLYADLWISEKSSSIQVNSL